jgi:hypothetical protein
VKRPSSSLSPVVMALVIVALLSLSLRAQTGPTTATVLTVLSGDAPAADAQAWSIGSADGAYKGNPILLPYGTVYRPFTVTSLPYNWLIPTGMSKWMSPRADAGPLAPGLYTYQRWVTFPQNCTPGTLEMYVRYVSDGALVYVTANQQWQLIGFDLSESANNPATWKSFRILSGLVPGPAANNISLTLFNETGPSGLLVTMYGKCVLQ